MSPVDLVGRILSIPETWWGFSGFRREWHPGLVVDVSPDRSSLWIVSGTDFLSQWGGRADRYVIQPEHLLRDRGEQGLTKATAFSLEPLAMRFRRIRQLLPDRIIGRLPIDVVADLYRRLKADDLASAA